jgi:tRNA-Thr(GGU) m(6)t(6)A37 methyltransferase TsaA
MSDQPDQSDHPQPDQPDQIVLEPIGFVRSELTNLEDAPRFYTEGAPNATIEILPAYRDGMCGLEPGRDIVVLTWLHLAERNVLQVHPRGDESNPLAGVFITRSQHRPNPIGLHRTTVLAVGAGGLAVGPIEVIDGTPVLDIKPVVESADY